MKKFLVLALAGIALIPTSALAADLGQPVYKAAPPPPPPLVYNWTGCFVGAGGGYGMWNQDATNETIPGYVSQYNTVTNGGRGWFGMGQAGCDYQFPAIGTNLVVGAFGDGAFGSLKGNVTGFASPGITAEEKETGSWAIGARAGWLVTPRFLSYFSGGYTQAHFDGFNHIDEDGLPNGSFTNSQTYNGWFLGSGFEYGIDFVPGLFLKTEYRYASYNSADVQNFNSDGTPNGFGFKSTKFIQTISTQLVYRFNWFGH